MTSDSYIRLNDVRKLYITLVEEPGRVTVKTSGTPEFVLPYNRLPGLCAPNTPPSHGPVHGPRTPRPFPALATPVLYTPERPATKLKMRFSLTVDDTYGLPSAVLH